MKILICTSTYAPARNGQAVFTTNLAEGMARRGHTVWVIMPSDRRTSYQSERTGVQIQTVRGPHLEFIHNETYGAAFPQREVNRFFRTSNRTWSIYRNIIRSACASKSRPAYPQPVIGTNHFMPENLLPYFPAGIH